jgi:uncharacterized protein YpmS
MGAMKTLGIVIVVVLLVAVLALGYLGFIPGLSDLLGATKPKDLGVKSTGADLASINAKTGVTYTALPSGTAAAKSEVVSGSKPLQTTVTQEELTAMVNDHSGKWKAYPASNVQVKINQDGTMEMTGTLRLDRLDNYVAATGATGEQVQQILATAKTLGSNPSFYGKWDIDVTNGQVTGTIDKITIGNLDLPQDQIQANKALIFQAIQGRLHELNINAAKITVTNGKLSFDGTVPTQVALAP